LYNKIARIIPLPFKFVQVFFAGTARTALGSTNSDNTGQLGNKITKGVSNQLKNKAINKTEGFVNNKANTFLNAFGAGRSEVSIGGLSSKKLTRCACDFFE
jgi:cell division GTPase FtsZ